MADISAARLALALVGLLFVAWEAITFLRSKRAKRPEIISSTVSPEALRLQRIDQARIASIAEGIGAFLSLQVVGWLFEPPTWLVIALVVMSVLGFVGYVVLSAARGWFEGISK